MRSCKTKALPERLMPFIWFFLRHHLFSMSGYILINVVAAFEFALAPYLLKVIIDTATLYSDNTTLFLKAIIYPAIFYVLLITLVHNIAFRIYQLITMHLFPKLRTEVSVALFKHLTKHSISFFQRNFSGDLASKTQNVSEGIESMILGFNQYICGNLFMLVISLVLLATVHVYFSIILFSGIMALILSGYFLNKKTTSFAHDFAEEKSQVTGQLVDSISNIMSTKIFSNTAHETNRIETVFNSVGRKDKLLQKHVMFLSFNLNIIYMIFVALLMFGLIYFRIHGTLTAGDFAFILGLSITTTNMISGLNDQMPEFSKNIGKCQQALNVIIAPHDVQDNEHAVPLHITEEKIHFKDVSFGYDANKFIFEKFNLTIAPKQKIGLVGYSGAGKTTLINLLFRLYDVQQGEISIDAQPINGVTRDSLMDNMVLIPQNTELFHRTIMDNIRYGDTKASDEGVIKAAKLAKCHEFISQLPEKYQSVVGERGITLSGGQRQRIAIARAILKNAPILVLDEATSALDSVTEKEIQDALNEVMKNKTVIVIAHRLSTIMAMDRILFLENGRIIEDGTVKELQKKNGSFAKLLTMQQQIKA